MSIFVSYSRLDEAVVKPLASGLEAADRVVWFDNDLSGGEVWWTKILQRIRQADVVMFGLSDHSWGSKPCRSELAYAEALDRHILPIKVGPIGNLRANPLSQLQTLEFRTDDAQTAFEIIGAVDDALRRPRPLPEVMPPEPQMPFAYLISLSEQIDVQELGNTAQVEAVYQLRKAYREETDESVHRDIVGILRRLKSKPWTSMQAAADIEDAFEWIDRQMIKRGLGADAGEPTVTPPPGSETGAAAGQSAAPLVAAEDARRRRFEQRLADRIGREQEERARREVPETRTRQGTRTTSGAGGKSRESGSGEGSTQRGSSSPAADSNGPAASVDSGIVGGAQHAADRPSRAETPAGRSTDSGSGKGRTFELANPSLPPRLPLRAAGGRHLGAATPTGVISPASGSGWTGVSSARIPPQPTSGSPPRPPWGWCIPALLTVVPGIVALYWAAQVNPRLARGDSTGARRASAYARGWAIAGIVVLGLALLIVLIVAFLAYARMS